MGMKRSEINAIIRDADAFIRQHQFYLPPFAHWTPEDWASKGTEVSEIVTHKLGWDITDFGLSDYRSKGLFLFTIRNGSPANLETGTGKVYAEKLLIVDVNQVTPYHFHWHKTEDIINRGGGRLLLKLYNSNADEGADEFSGITVSLDGVETHLPAGGVVTLNPGESITLPTGLYHQFWAEGERVLVGEVSSVNNDDTDNKFLDPIGRFTQIEEDEPPYRLLVFDYATHLAITP
jgi:D-lyxose ketol-isomerase